MPAHNTPYPPLELDFEEISSLRRAPSAEEVAERREEPTSDSRLTAAPSFDLDAFARDTTGEHAPAPDSEVRPVADLARTAAPPPLPADASTASLVSEMNDYLDAGDFKSALVVADALLAEDPQNA